MDVNKKNLIFLLTFVCMHVLYADISPVKDTVKVYVEKNLKKALTQWGKQVKVCQEKEEKNPLHFEPESLEKLNITLLEFRTATMTLNYKNYMQCIKEKENEFMFQSLLVYKIQKENGEEGKDALNFVLEALPSSEVLEAFIKYEKLFPKVKAYFEKYIGIEPFNIVKVSMPILKYFRK